VSNVVSFKGVLLAGPPKSSTNAFPSGLTNATFDLNPPNKAASVATGMQTPNVVSPSAYATLSGVGPAATVTQGTFLYLRTTGKMLIRITTAGDSGDVVSVLYVNGILALEFPTANYLKLLEAQGTGIVEYFASGNQ
jgi:hypothetical protein